jgi:hypothetical protein
MGWPLIFVCMAIYAFVGITELQRGHMFSAMMWFGYAFSNIGLGLMTYKGHL